MTRGGSRSAVPSWSPAAVAPVERLAAKAWQVFREEVSQWSPGLTVAQLAMAPLPAFTGNRLRSAIMRAAGFHIGHGTVIFGRIRFTGSANPSRQVSIGSNGVISLGCLFDAADKISIGDHVGIGQQVVILTNRHEIGPPTRRLGALRVAPVHIGDGAWLSTRAILLPGVTVGAGAVVAAGAVVTRSVPAHTLVAGVPARPLRTLPT